MRAALCLLLVIAPVCAQPPKGKDEGKDARAFLAFMTKFAELRKVETDAVGNDVALARAQKATRAFVEALKGKEVVWPVTVVRVRAADKSGLCAVECRDLVAACRDLHRATGLPGDWAKAARALRALDCGDAALVMVCAAGGPSSCAVALPEAEAEGLKKGNTYLVRMKVLAAVVTVQTGRGACRGGVLALKALLVK